MLVIEEDEEEDLCLVSRASAHLSKLMDQFNCLTKIHNDKNANFQVELSKVNYIDLNMIFHFFK